MSSATQKTTRSHYSGYALVVLFDERIIALKRDVQASINQEALLDRPMQNYIAHATIARELPSEKLVSTLRILPEHAFKVTIGQLKLLATNDYNLLVLTLKTARLSALNESIQLICQQQECFAYHPHITLACLNKSSADAVYQQLLSDDSLIKKHLHDQCWIMGYALYDPTGNQHIIHKFTTPSG